METFTYVYNKNGEEDEYFRTPHSEGSYLIYNQDQATNWLTVFLDKKKRVDMKRRKKKILYSNIIIFPSLPLPADGTGFVFGRGGRKRREGKRRRGRTRGRRGKVRKRKMQTMEICVPTSKSVTRERSKFIRWDSLHVNQSECLQDGREKMRHIRCAHLAYMKWE